MGIRKQGKRVYFDVQSLKTASLKESGLTEQEQREAEFIAGGGRLRPRCGAEGSHRANWHHHADPGAAHQDAVELPQEHAEREGWPVMSDAGKGHTIEVQDSTGKKLGTVVRNLGTGLWRATRRPPKVWLGGQQHQPALRGRGKEAQLVVRLPPGAALPKELAGLES